MNSEEVVDIFGKGKFEWFALTEMKLKGNREVSWCGVNGIIASVHEIEKGKEGVAILLNDVWHIAVIDFGCASFRILWIKLKISRVKDCVEVGYGPNEADGEERNRL